MPRRRSRQAGFRLLICSAAVFTISSLSTQQALAAGIWITTAAGSAVGQSAIMPMGKSPMATVLEGSVRLDWAPSTFATGKEVGGYIVKRQVLGSTDAVQICTVVAPLRTCQDSKPPDQQVVYVVVPSQQLWRGPASPPSSPVTMPAAPIAATVVVPAATATPLPSPSASPNPTPSPDPTPSPTDPPSPTPSPS